MSERKREGNTEGKREIARGREGRKEGEGEEGENRNRNYLWNLGRAAPQHSGVKFLFCGRPLCGQRRGQARHSSHCAGHCDGGGHVEKALQGGTMAKANP